MNTKYIIFIVVIIILGFGTFLGIANYNRVAEDAHHDDDDTVEAYEIYPGDVVEKIQNEEEIVLLDVRTAEEYSEVHLENALLLPVQELSQQSLEDIGLGIGAKDREIIIYCRSGARSKTAYDIMSSLGYTNIKSSAGGMVHWLEDEYPFTESGEYKDRTINTQTDTITGGAEISFDRNIHDFGLIPQSGGTVETTFVVKNEGDEDLIIGDITTSCSCTSATVTNKTIAPGEETSLAVIFDPDFHEEPLGVFKRTVFIPTNDPQNTEASVSIQVDIEEGK